MPYLFRPSAQYWTLGALQFYRLVFLSAFLLVGTAQGGLLSAETANLARPTAEPGSTKVRVGFYLADLNEISASDQTFLADVVVQAEWHDPRLAGRWPEIHNVALDDAWNPNLQLLNQRGNAASLPQRVEVDPRGVVRWRQRWIGRFSARMNLRDFPLDRQRLHVQLVSLGHTPGEVELLVGTDDVPSGRATEFSVTDWSVGPATAELKYFEPAPGAKVLAGARLSWDAQRYIGYQAVPVIFPLVLIVMMGGQRSGLMFRPFQYA